MAKDQFAQIAYLSVTESAATTLTFEELSIAAELDKKKAMVIHRIEYNVAGGSLALLIAAGDQITCGLSLSNSITSTSLDKAEVFDRINIFYSAGLPAGGIMEPIDRRFTDMPGGGLLVPVKKLFLFTQGVSIASATTVQARIWYTIKNLSPADYLELADAFQILT